MKDKTPVSRYSSYAVKFAVMCLAIAFFSFLVSAEQLSKEQQTPADKDPVESFKLLLEKAEQGDAAAQYTVGYCYRYGKGVEKNQAEAFKWYLKAAEQGYAQAQYAVGYYYEKGEGVDKNLPEVFKWYLRAAEQGYAQAQYAVGSCYECGEGVSKNQAKAFKWYLKAAEQGNVDAQYVVGICYWYGEGVKKNQAESFKWYLKAAKQGDAEAQYAVGSCYKYGEGVEKNAEEGFKWNFKAAEQGNCDAQMAVAFAYVFGCGVEKNVGEAVRWMEIVYKNKNVNSLKTIDTVQLFLVSLLVDISCLQTGLLEKPDAAPMALVSFFKVYPLFCQFCFFLLLALLSGTGGIILLIALLGKKWRYKNPKLWVLALIAGVSLLVGGMLLMTAASVWLKFGVAAGVWCAGILLLLGLTAVIIVLGPGRFRKVWTVLCAPKNRIWMLLSLLFMLLIWLFKWEFLWFLYVGLTYVLFMPLCVLAYLGIKRKWARYLSMVWLAFILSAAVAFVTLLSDNARILVLVFSIFAALTALLPFSAAFRRFCGKVCGQDDWTEVRTIALATTISLTCVCFVPLLVIGAPPLLVSVAKKGGHGDLWGTGRMLTLNFYGLIWTLIVAAFAVGYGIQRNRSEVLQRLGLYRPTARQLKLSVIFIAMFFWGSFFLDIGIRNLWQWNSWPVTDFDAFSELIKYAFTPVGAVVIGVCAGLGEEVAVRGILQPRLGILLSNLFFTSLHAFQYNWDGLLSVFLIGCVLGLIRKRTNTSTAAIVHGAYDFVLIIGEALAMKTI